jgi:hypothetical protein
MAVGNQTPGSVATDFAALQFTIQQLLSRVQTHSLVRIIDCTNDGGIEPVGTVTVQPLVNMMSGDRVAVKHKPLYKLPYQRVQGGVNAIIIDPKPGDIGLAGFCSRDISAVKNAKDIANPGSFRQFDMADGIYLFTCLGVTAPTQYLVLNDDGATIVSPVAITLQAPTINLKGAVVQTDGDVTMANNLDVAGTIHGAVDVIADNISGKTHTHNDPQGGVVGPPNP